jgi:hypothetical protein
MRSLFFAVIFLMAACSNFYDYDTEMASHPQEIVGTYVNQSTTEKTILSLSADGRGGMLTFNNDGSFKQLMTFTWGIQDPKFVMSHIYFTEDKKRVVRVSRGDATDYSLDGMVLRSKGKDGQWIIWNRTSKNPDFALINAIKHV